MSQKQNAEQGPPSFHVAPSCRRAIREALVGQRDVDATPQTSMRRCTHGCRRIVLPLGDTQPPKKTKLLPPPRLARGRRINTRITRLSVRYLNRVLQLNGSTHKENISLPLKYCWRLKKGVTRMNAQHLNTCRYVRSSRFQNLNRKRPQFSVYNLYNHGNIVSFRAQCAGTTTVRLAAPRRAYNNLRRSRQLVAGPSPAAPATGLPRRNS